MSGSAPHWPDLDDAPHWRAVVTSSAPHWPVLDDEELVDVGELGNAVVGAVSDVGPVDELSDRVNRGESPVRAGALREACGFGPSTGACRWEDLA